MKEDTNKTWIGVHGGYAKDMTLRDHFAGLAMQAIVGREDFESEDWVWETAYDMADAMLAVKQSREAK